jgi:hypothetical protein
MDDENDLTPRWLVTCLYNSAAAGSGQAITLLVKHEDPMEALREGWKAAARKDPRGICITGLSCVEIPKT